MYSKIRQLEPEQGWRAFRRERDVLLKTHHRSPLSEPQRGRFKKLEYFPYDFQWRLTVPLEPPSSQSPIEIDLGEEGDFRITEMGRVRIRADARLSLYWVEGYGGGLFLPFADGTNGGATYGGGRYLLDGIKGADLGMQGEQLILDFNFAYNPSCVYDERWVCPLPPERNRLPFEVEAGEKAFHLDPA
ncbi:MAG: DUF1684 domain-containing protein [Anaerolineae bacterium]|nr:MAG: DUF1684 domain-containing protein [Anaerolineae bacterium]